MNGTLEQLASLPADWDGYGSNPPHQDTIEWARKIAAEFPSVAPEYSPGSGGAIQINFCHGKREVELYIAPNIGLEYLQISNGGVVHTGAHSLGGSATTVCGALYYWLMESEKAGPPRSRLRLKR